MASSNKPRNSILHLFDPLVSPATPRRDASPDSGSSDKENDLPPAPGEVTVFFNRIYTSNRNAAPPSTPQGPLIDIGDAVTPQDEGSGREAGVGRPDPAADCAPRDAKATGAAMRLPLADLELEDTPCKPRGKRSQLSMCTNASSDSDEPATPPRAVSAAPPGAPLAGVINSINLQSLTISRPEAVVTPPPFAAPALQRVDEDLRQGEEIEDAVAVPTRLDDDDDDDDDDYIRDSPVSSEADCSLTEVELPPTSDSPSDRMFSSSEPVPPMLPSPRSRPSLIPDDDLRRVSVDLQTSFNMHMQSPEMSFDLLNDKISFLGHGNSMESLWAGAEGDDKTFGVDRKLEAKAEDIEAASASAFHDAAQFSPSQIFSLPQQVGISELDSSTEASFPFSKRIFKRPSLSKIQTKTPSSNAALSAVTESPASPSSLPPIPALRVTKKSKYRVAHERTDSGTSSTSSSSASQINVRLRTAGGAPADPAEASTQSQDDVNSSGSGSSPTSAPVATRSRTVIRGVQRPPVVSEITPSGVLVPSGSAQTQPARRPGSGAASAAAGRFAAAGVQRPDVLRGQKAAPSPGQTTAAPLSRSQKAASASAFAIGAGGAAGARATVARPGVGVPKPRATAVRPSGLKAPTRFGASESGAAGVSAPASALPRPASRHPALAGVGRGLRGRADGSGNTTGTKKAM